jgi:hypothetical protein
MTLVIRVLGGLLGYLGILVLLAFIIEPLNLSVFLPLLCLAILIPVNPNIYSSSSNVPKQFAEILYCKTQHYFYITVITSESYSPIIFLSI